MDVTRWRADTTSPTASVGLPIAADTPFEIHGNDVLRNIDDKFAFGVHLGRKEHKSRKHMKQDCTDFFFTRCPSRFMPQGLSLVFTFTSTFFLPIALRN